MPLPLPGLLAGVLIVIGALAQPGPAMPPHVSVSPYLEIVQRYRSGEFEAAIGQLAAHPTGHLEEQVMSEFIALTPIDAAPAVRAAAILHLETGYALMQRAEITRGQAHLALARGLAAWTPGAPARGQRDAPRPPDRRQRPPREVMPPQPSPRGPEGRVIIARPSRPVIESEIGPTPEERSAGGRNSEERRRAAFQRDVDIATLWAYQTYRMTEVFSRQLGELRMRYPRDADVLVALGSTVELRALARGRPTAARARTGIDRNARALASSEVLKGEAAMHFRAALAIDSSQAEAGVRLGRVLLAQGKLKDARAALEDALDPEPPMALHYLGSLFLAQVLGAQGDAAGELARYQAVAARWPECQSARVALSRALGKRGDHAAAARALEPLRIEHGARACNDPWWIYNLGQAWRWGPFVQALRERVTKEGPR